MVDTSTHLCCYSMYVHLWTYVYVQAQLWRIDLDKHICT